MSEDQRREWEYFKEKVIPAYIERLNDLEEKKVDIDKTKKDIILEMADRCEQFMESDAVARFLLIELKGIVSKSWLEEILGKKHKRPYDRYQDQQSPFLDISNKENNKTIEVSTSGSQSVTGPDGNEQEQEIEQEIDQEKHFPTYGDKNPASYDTKDAIAERSAEIALNTIDILKKELQEKDTRINEAFSLIKDKEKRIHELQMQMGEIEVELGNLKKNPPTKKNVDEKEELQIKYDELKIAYEELKQVETIRTKQQDFKSASQVASGPKVWIAAVNISGFSRALVQISMHLNPRASQGKVLFDVTDDGQLKNPRPEGS